MSLIKSTDRMTVGQPVNLRDFSHLVSGSDWRPALLAAAALGRIIYVPTGDYPISSGLTLPAVIYGDGTTSRLIFSGTGDGLLFDAAQTGATAGAVSIAILKSGAQGGRAIRTNQSLTYYHPRRSRYVFRDVLTSGVTAPAEGANNGFEYLDGWLTHYEIGDAWHCEIDSCNGYGTFRVDTDPAGQQQDCYIRLNAAFTLLTTRIRGITCANLYRGIEIGDRVFFQITDFDIAHTYDGIYQIGVTQPFGESRLTGGNINAQHWGVSFANIGTRQISGVVVRRHKTGWKGAGHDWYGIRLVTCNYTWVTDCQCQPDESSGAFTGVQYALWMQAGGGIHVDGLVVGANLDRGILADNVTMLTVGNVMSFQNAATDYVFRLINNTRATLLRNPVLVSTFSGAVYSDDGTVGSSTVRPDEGMINARAAAPQLGLYETDAPANEHVWRWASTAGDLFLQMQADDGSNTNVMVIQRTGTTVDLIDLRCNVLKIANGPTWNTGTGSPEGVVTAIRGSLFSRTDGGVGSSLYYKSTGSTATGWTAVA